MIHATFIFSDKILFFYYLSQAMQLLQTSSKWFLYILAFSFFSITFFTNIVATIFMQGSLREEKKIIEVLHMLHDYKGKQPMLKSETSMIVS
jgi:hypothetical protein